MTLYDGDLKTWYGGHSHPNETGEAGEAWNFSRTASGLVHGYVQNAGERRLNIYRLGAVSKADRVEGVTVAWCSRRPTDNELALHGWYENATVFREAYGRPDGKRFGNWIVSAYFTAAADGAHLLAPDQRDLVVPSKMKGTMGQTDILYVDQVNPPLANRLRDYLAAARPLARRPGPAPGTPPDQRGWGGGESARHLALKMFVRDNPACLDLGLKAAGREEYILPSLDGIDVIFRTPKQTVAVEVKPRNCGEAEHWRGLFQCVKYRALVEAEDFDRAQPLPCTPVLVTEDALSEEHQKTATRFGILHRLVRIEG